MRALVTGAGGWLGQNLVRALAGRRERVRCLVHHEAEAPLLELVAPTVETIVGDVRDPATVDRLFEAVGPATIFNSVGVRLGTFLPSGPLPPARVRSDFGPPRKLRGVWHSPQCPSACTR